MPIRFTCECGKKLQARDDFGGRRMKCPNCHRPLNIPHGNLPALPEAQERVTGANGPAAAPPAGHVPAAPAAAPHKAAPTMKVPLPLPSEPPPHATEPPAARPLPSRPVPPAEFEELTEVMEQPEAHAVREPEEV